MHEKGTQIQRITASVGADWEVWFSGIGRQNFWDRCPRHAPVDCVFAEASSTTGRIRPRRRSTKFFGVGVPQDGSALRTARWIYIAGR